jgi:hypothetical protein
MGFALENFDAVGAYRTTENGAPIDATGALDGKPFNGALELAQVLKGDARVVTCLVRELYRHLSGQDATDGAESLLKDSESRFAAGGHRFRDLALGFVTSPVFRSVGKPL